MTTRTMHDQNVEKHFDKQMGGCIAGFFHLFDRSHILSGKRLHTKRLTASKSIESTSDSVSSVRSVAPLAEFEGPLAAKSSPSPDHLRPPAIQPPKPAMERQTPVPAVSSPTRSPVAVTTFDFKEGMKSPWKFGREAPRLSLDSRAIVDAKGKLHPREIRTTPVGGERCGESARNSGEDESERLRRSPSVVARLMGLDQPLPSSHSGADELLPSKKAQLRKSASESRSRDRYGFVDGNFSPANHQCSSNSVFATSSVGEYNNRGKESNSIENFPVSTQLNAATTLDHGSYVDRRSTEPGKLWSMPQRKGLYDAGDFFPEPRPSVSVFGELEKRLKMRGIEEPSKDLETLKQIFEALQLKGLLHSKNTTSEFGHRSLVHERRFPREEYPIVVMKPARSPRRIANEPSPPPGFRSKAAHRRSPSFAGGDSLPSASPRREKPEMIRSPIRTPNPSSPARNEHRSTSPVTAKKRLNVDTSRRMNEIAPAEPRRVSPVQSPKYGFRRTDQSPRRQRSTVEDESSAISESSFSTSSQIDTERLKMEDAKDGKSLLERCDKLIHSIAEMTAITELQPSPVSVLDSSFYKEESSPSPVMKRTIDFKDLEDDPPSPSSSSAPFPPKPSDAPYNADDQQHPDLAYISDIIRASNHLPNNPDLFSLLEKQQQQSLKGRNTSNPSTLNRKLIFDFVTEIRDRHSHLPPWDPASSEPQPSQVWSELQGLGPRGGSEDLFEVIRGVMKRDMNHGWGECHVETSEAVLDIERLVFKDLIGETIAELGALPDEALLAPRRRLVF